MNHLNHLDFQKYLAHRGVRLPIASVMRLYGLVETILRQQTLESKEELLSGVFATLQYVVEKNIDILMPEEVENLKLVCRN